MAEIDRIAQLVIESLKPFSLKKGEILLSDSLARDLIPDSDDGSEWISLIQKRFHFRARNSEWRKVDTVMDAVKLIYKYTND